MSDGIKLTDLPKLTAEANDQFKKDAMTCKGLFYRYTESAFKSKNGFGKTQKLTKLKRMSCKGCSSCMGMEDAIYMDFSEVSQGNHQLPIILPNNIENGDIISPYLVSGRPDWETGVVEEYEVHCWVCDDKGVPKQG